MEPGKSYQLNTYHVHKDENSVSTMIAETNFPQERNHAEERRTSIS
jgi:hypothetical protein